MKWWFWNFNRKNRRFLLVSLSLLEEHSILLNCYWTGHTFQHSVQSINLTLWQVLICEYNTTCHKWTRLQINKDIWVIPCVCVLQSLTIPSQSSATCIAKLINPNHISESSNAWKKAFLTLSCPRVAFDVLSHFSFFSMICISIFMMPNWCMLMAG